MRQIVIILFLLNLIFLSACEERKITNPVDTRYDLQPPKILTAGEISDEMFYISWELNKELYSNYHIFRKEENQLFVEIGQVSSNGSSFIDSTYDKNSGYIYGISAHNDQNKSGILEIEKTDYAAGRDTIYSEYGSVRNQITFNEHISLSWEIYLNSVKNYVIEKISPGSNDFEHLVELSPDIKNYIDEDVNNCASYIYRLTIVKSDNKKIHLNPMRVDISKIFSNRYVNSGHDYAKAIFSSKDENFYIFGKTLENESGIRFIKSDYLGNIIHTNLIPTSANESIRAICETNDNGFIIGNHDGTPLLINVNAQGSEQWRREYIIDRQIHSIALTSDGGFIVGGETMQGLGGGWLMKIDNVGIMEWEKIYDDHFSIKSCVQTNNGDYILCLPKGPDHYTIMKTDNTGNILWTRSITDGEIIKVIRTKSNDFVFLTFGLINEYTHLMKYDEHGNRIWKYIITKYSFPDIFPSSIIELSDFSYLVSLIYSPNPSKDYRHLLWKISEEGDLNWDIIIGENIAALQEPISNIAQINDYEAIVLGTGEEVENIYDKDLEVSRIELQHPNCD